MVDFAAHFTIHAITISKLVHFTGKCCPVLAKVSVVSAISILIGLAIRSLFIARVPHAEKIFGVA